MDKAKYYISWMTWPALLTICTAITAYGFMQGKIDVFGMRVDAVLIYFNVAYLFLIISLFFLERWMPHEKEWHKADGQTVQSLLHTLSSKGTVQGLFIFGSVIGLAEFITPASEPGYGIWPRDWPMWIQVILALVVAEFGLYWAHRGGHEFPILWRFHVVHHSVTRLWWLNTGRFHFIDSLVSIVLGLSILLALGAPMEVVKWMSAMTAFFGMLTHCNVEMRFGPLSWFFNTPELHRWHHSTDLREGNKNYCESIMLWDHVFGTWVNPQKRPPVHIGATEYTPDGFWHQIIWPFLSIKKRQEIAPEYKPKRVEHFDKAFTYMGNLPENYEPAPPYHMKNKS